MNFNVTQRRSQVSPFELVASDSFSCGFTSENKSTRETIFFSKIVVMNLEHLHLLDLNLSLKFFFIRFHSASKNLRATKVLFCHS